MKDYNYQYGFSEMYAHAMYDVEMREQKAKKMMAVFDDYYSGKLDNLSLLDVGCSTGIIANTLSKRFAKVTGTDIDEPAVEFAKKNFQSDQLQFSVQDSMNLKWPDDSFDAVVCAQVYEHVPDAQQLMAEIYRVLKPGGICYFAAGNGLVLIEPHYKLPLLSVIPKPLAHTYLRILRRGDFYYENLLPLWSLRKLVSKFEIIDYSLKIVQDPQNYYATEMVSPGSLQQKIAIGVLQTAYWLFPSYIWLLRKHG